MDAFELINYDRCITNLANSILQKYGVDTQGRKSLEAADEYLKKDHKNVVVFLLDALGINILEHNLSEDGFFRKHMVTEYHSVYPPTTVAATTAMLSGKNPCETGWLGWDCFIPQIGENVEMFTNNITGTKQPVADYNVANTYFAYDNILEQINQLGTDVSAYGMMPFMPPFPDSLEKIIAGVKELCQKPGKKFVYAYWNEPDTTMHQFGCYGPEAKAIAKELEEKVENLCKDLQDTLVIVTADHGHMDSKNYCIHEFEKLDECLYRTIAIEPRTLNLFVKPEKKEQFESEFSKQFGDDFLLLTKEEAIEKQTFGMGTQHASFHDMLGDFIAIAVKDVSIFNTYEEKEKFVGAHAGLTKDEMMIPLIVIEKG